MARTYVMRGIAAAILFAAGLAPSAVAETYRVVPAESELVVEVGRAGFLKVLGHDHDIRVEAFSGTVEWDAASPESSEFELTIDAGSLVVADEELSDDDRVKVQTDMETQALAVAEHATIAFTSRSVEHRGAQGGGQRLRINGLLSLRGVSRELSVPVILEEAGNNLTARGDVEFESKDWGVPQIAALGGSVKTKTKLKLSFEIALARE